MDTSNSNQITPRETQALRDLVGVVRPALIVEFGSWQGRSALTFLTEARSLGLGSKIICVDTWLGSAEHWRNSLPDSEWSFDQLNLRNGEPRILETFWQAIKDHDLADQTSIVRAPTIFAAPFLRQQGVKPELVYVDADHSFGAVYQDLRLAESIVAKNGVIAGDDFTWQSVRLAIGRFIKKEHMLMVSSDRSQFVVLKKAQNPIIAAFRSHGWTTERFLVIREIPLLYFRFVARPFRQKVVDRLYLFARSFLRLPVRSRGGRL